MYLFIYLFIMKIVHYEITLSRSSDIFVNENEIEN